MKKQSSQNLGFRKIILKLKNHKKEYGNFKKLRTVNRNLYTSLLNLRHKKDLTNNQKSILTNLGIDIEPIKRYTPQQTLNELEVYKEKYGSFKRVVYNHSLYQRVRNLRINGSEEEKRRLKELSVEKIDFNHLVKRLKNHKDVYKNFNLFQKKDRNLYSRVLRIKRGTRKITEKQRKILKDLDPTLLFLRKRRSNFSFDEILNEIKEHIKKYGGIKGLQRERPSIASALLRIKNGSKKITEKQRKTLVTLNIL